MKNVLQALTECFSRPPAKIKKIKKKGYASHEEAARRHQALEQYFRAKFGLSLHPLQSDPSIVPSLDVAGNVQAPNKSHPDTFFATGCRQALDYLKELEGQGLDPRRMDAILEFGVGTGRLLVHYLPFKAALYGCDVNPLAVEWTRRTLGKRADIRLTPSDPPLPYGPESFDLIYANSVFTHIPFAKHELWVKELARLLKPGGCLIASVHDLDKIEKHPAPEGWFELGVEKGLHMDTYLSKEKLCGIWQSHFDTIDIRPQWIQTHVIARKNAPRVETLFDPSQSLLKKARASEIVREPFPHLVIRDALDPALYDRLEREFPADETVMGGKPAGSNKKYFYGASKVLADERISPLWKGFFRTHLSGEFYRQAIELFRKEIFALYPDIESKLGKRLEELATGVRRLDVSAEAWMDCQFAINSPVAERSSVRGPHLDGADTLFQCLLYFRDPRDQAGGDLELFRFKKGVPTTALEAKSIDPRYVEKAASVPYEKNTLIVFLNSPFSLHGVSPRDVTTHTRRYADVLCDLPIRLFEAPGGYE